MTRCVAFYYPDSLFRCYVLAINCEMWVFHSIFKRSILCYYYEQISSSFSLDHLKFLASHDWLSVGNQFSSRMSCHVSCKSPPKRNSLVHSSEVMVSLCRVASELCLVIRKVIGILPTYEINVASLKIYPEVKGVH